MLKPASERAPQIEKSKSCINYFFTVIWGPGKNYIFVAGRLVGFYDYVILCDDLQM